MNRKRKRGSSKEAKKAVNAKSTGMKGSGSASAERFLGFNVLSLRRCSPGCHGSVARNRKESVSFVAASDIL